MTRRLGQDLLRSGIKMMASSGSITKALVGAGVVAGVGVAKLVTHVKKNKTKSGRVYKRDSKGRFCR